MKLSALASFALLVFGPWTGAAAADAMDTAEGLGRLMAGADACGLNLDQAAIEAFIADRVPEDDLDFNRFLTFFSDSARSQLGGMSKRQLETECFQTTRAARALKLVRE